MSYEVTMDTELENIEPVFPGGKSGRARFPGAVTFSSSSQYVSLFYVCFCLKTLFVFWPRHTACEILVPRPGIEPVHPAVEAQSPNRWTTREVPKDTLFNINCCFVNIDLTANSTTAQA